MSDDSIFAQRSAIFLGGLLLAGFAVVASFAATDRKNRTVIETLAEPSAAGAAAVYVLPPEGERDPSAPILTVKGVPLYENKHAGRPDGAMMKSGTDDTGRYPLYRRYRNDELQPPLYLKLAPGEYLRLNEVPPKKRLAPAEEEGAPKAVATPSSPDQDEDENEAKKNGEAAEE